MADVGEEQGGQAAAVAAVLGLTDDEEAYLAARPDVWNKLAARISEHEALGEQLATSKAECEALTSNFGMALRVDALRPYEHPSCAQITPVLPFLAFCVSATTSWRSLRC